MMAQLVDSAPTQRNVDSIMAFDLSAEESVFEGVGGGEVVGGKANILDNYSDLQNQITQLRFQFQKLTDECAELKQQNAGFLDENLQLLSQKDELEKKLSSRDIGQERIKQLSKELDESRSTIASLEDLNSILNIKNMRFEKYYFELEEKFESIKTEHNTTLSELDQLYKKLRQKDEENEMIKHASEDVVNGWISKYKWMEDRMTDLHETVEELSRTNSQLRNEKFELENTLIDISENHLALLNSPDDNNSSRSSSVCSSKFPRSPSSYLRQSLQAEIAATIERKRSLPVLQLSSTEIEVVDASTQSEESSDEGIWNVRVRPQDELRSLCNQVIISMRKIVASKDGAFERNQRKFQKLFKHQNMGNCLSHGSSEKEDHGSVSIESGTADLMAETGCTSAEDLIRRLNQELAEFRQQLKKSGDILNAAQNTGSVCASLSNVTQSCPFLAESKTPKPMGVTCSTQTDCLTQRQRSQDAQDAGGSLLDEDSDGYSLDKISDDIRLTINLPTVIEESEQETETSPRKMEKGGSGRRKGKLIRSLNAHDEDAFKDCVSLSGSGSGGPDGAHLQSGSGAAAADQGDGRSSSNYESAASSISIYNSLERPLQINRNGGDSDSGSFRSEGNTTFGSPLSIRSSITSPTYWTPLEGSSSQETITNIDGDKTPVNDKDTNGHGLDRTEVYSCPIPKRDYAENGLRQRCSSSLGPSLPMYDTNLETSSVGVISDSDREYMIQYAFDAVRRSSESTARFLSGPEWRTLRMDLDKKDQENFRKTLEGNDIESGVAVEKGCNRARAPDLEEDAEECLEKFPGLVEELFGHLDVLKRTQKSPSEFDLETISARFNHLAHTFKVEHCNLTQRKDINLSNREHAKNKMENIIRTLTNILQEFDEAGKKSKFPEEVTKLTTTLKHIPEDLEIYTNDLSKTSRRVGMMDVQVRLYKMIEVMVLYVHILRNLCAEKDKEFQGARKLLEKHNISYSRTKAVSSMNNNNNNNEKVSCDETQVNEGDTLRDEVDGEPKQLLQHLLGPKKSNVDLDYKIREKLVLKEEKSSSNPILKITSDIYETLRCELFWPWNWDETWKGMKQGFSMILMFVGLFVIFRSLFPIVNANANDPSSVADLGSVFSKHGNLIHPNLPRV